MRTGFVFCGALGAIGAVQYYAWCRLARDTHLPAWMRWGIGALQAALTCALPLVSILRHQRIEPPVSLVGLGFIWAGMTFLTMTWLLISEVPRLVWLRLASKPIDPQRRIMLSRMLGGGVATLGACASGMALREAAAGPRVDRVQVPLPRLPKALSGFTIAQISDLHIAPLLGPAYVERVVEQANALQAQVIVITGDLVDGSVEQLRPAADLLAKLHAPQGVYFVTGNHEYYSGADAWLAHLTTLGIVPLRNSRVEVGMDGHTFDLAGIDDLSGARHRGHGPDIQAALAGRDSQRALVLLAHQPKAIFMAAAHGVGLMLSGHTHAGQLWPLGVFVRFVQPYVEGLALHENTYIYVNRGTGYVGPPMRLGAVPEITLIELVA